MCVSVWRGDGRVCWWGYVEYWGEAGCESVLTGYGG